MQKFWLALILANMAGTTSSAIMIPLHRYSQLSKAQSCISYRIYLEKTSSCGKFIVTFRFTESMKLMWSWRLLSLFSKERNQEYLFSIRSTISFISCLNSAGSNTSTSSPCASSSCLKSNRRESRYWRKLYSSCHRLAERKWLHQLFT